MKTGIIICCLFFAQAMFAQKSTLSGYLKDAETGEALIGGRIYIDSLKIGVVSNIYGFYSLTLPNGTHDVMFSFIGKEPIKTRVILDQNIELAINLKDNSNTLTEVVVTGEKKQQESTEMSTVTLSMEKVKTLPVLLGEKDIIKTLQLLPGVQSGSEGSSGIYVRGGGPDQNLILLDGVPIYNANHLFGFFSVFNADAINQVKLVKGGFPAEYGGRISSVIDIRMNEGDMKKIHGEGSVGIISSKLMLNGPIIKDKTSFMITGRRTYIDLLARPLIKAANSQNGNDQVTGGYFFYDVNAKLNHIINANNRIYLSTYLGNDKFYVNSEYDYINDSKTYIEENTGGIKWGNKIVALRWNHKFSPKLLLNTTLNYSDYQFTTGFGLTSYEKGNQANPTQDFSFEYLSGITDFGGNMNFYYYPSPKHDVQFGIGQTYHTFKPGVNQLKLSDGSSDLDTSFGSARTYAHEFYGYIQDDFSITKRLSLNAGLHFANFLVREKLYNSLQPRASFNFQLDDKSSLKASYAKTTQFLHLLTNTSIGLPTDLWVPVTDSIPPQQGNQVAFGYTRELPKGYRVSAEAYYKTMKNLIEYKEGASFFGSNQNWEGLVEVGNGYSYGLEMLFEKRTGKTTGWIGYTLSWTNRQFANINNGEEFPYRYDRRHDISFVLTHKFNDKVDIGVVWVYGTGNAITLALQKYNSSGGVEFGDSEVNHIDQRNGYRMPSYHRLDLGVNIHKPKKWGEATWSFGLYNAYNRQNPFYLDIGYLQGGNEKVLKQISLFPILPSVSYSFKF